MFGATLGKVLWGGAGLLAVAKSPLVLAIGAGLAGWKVGDKLFTDWLGPLMDEAFKGGERAANVAQSTHQVGSFVIDKTGKTQKAFKVDGLIRSEVEARHLARARGYGTLEEALADPDSGFHRATARVNKATGTAKGGQKLYTDPDATNRATLKKQELQEAIVLEKSGYLLGGASRKDAILKMAGMLREHEIDLLEISSKTFANETLAEEGESGAEKIIAGMRPLWKMHMSMANKGDVTKSDVNRIWSSFPMSNMARKKKFGSVWSGASESGGGFFGLNNNRVLIQGKGPGELIAWPPKGMLGEDYIRRYGRPGSLFKPEDFGLDPILGLQRGALVQRPTMALVAEAGPEAVIPLHQAPAFIAEVLSKTVNSLSRQQVGLQRATSPLAVGGGGGGGRGTDVNTSVVTNIDNRFESRPPLNPRDGGNLWLATG